MVGGSIVYGSVLLVPLVFPAGLYALMAAAVARRTREIGIRIAQVRPEASPLASPFVFFEPAPPCVE